VIHMLLPSLKERREDIPLLIKHLIHKFNRLQGRDIAGVATEVLARLMAYDFPGNVRELENIIEQAFVLCRSSMITLDHLPAEFRPQSTETGRSFGPMSLQNMEKQFITQTVQYHKGNRQMAAKDLGINVATLYRKIKSLQIEVPEFDGRGKRR
jgi:DNA-binding NtrC family response regulator